MPQMTLWVEEHAESGADALASATLDVSGKERTRLWYRVPAEHRGLLANRGDPFVLGALFAAMHQGTDMVVHGEVSPSLLRNLEEFQSAWVSWRAGSLTKVGIAADSEKEHSELKNVGQYALTFSGGLDSCFTAFRHRTAKCGRLTRNLTAAVMVHGFDIALHDTDTFHRAADKAEKLLRSVGLPLIRMATNFRDLPGVWIDAHGAGLASCLHLLAGGCSGGLIASTDSYGGLVLPMGSNPVTDPLLGSDSFAIIHDGAGYTRMDKMRAILSWSDALRSIRVCWAGPQRDRNCGKCEKCIRTILGFRAIGAALPAAFERDVTDTDILALEIPKDGAWKIHLSYLQSILAAARDAHLSASWVSALDRAVKRNRSPWWSLWRGRRAAWQRLRKRAALRTRLRCLLRREADGEHVDHRQE